MGKKRWYIYVPQIVKGTFVFFFFQGDETSRSWSITDFSKPGSPTVYRPGDFPQLWSAKDVLGMAGNFVEKAERRSVKLEADWHRDQIIELNKKYHLPSLPTSP